MASDRSSSGNARSDEGRLRPGSPPRRTEVQALRRRTEALLPDLSVVVVAHSRERTRALRLLLACSGFTVAAEACTAVGAEEAVVRHRPDAVLLDMVGSCDGLEAIERIMGTRPTPIVVSGSVTEHSPAARAAGAVDVVDVLDAPPDSQTYAAALRRHLRVASRVRVITHPRSRLRAQGIGPGSSGRGATASPAAISGLSADPAAASGHSAVGSPFAVVVIGASTGGPPALASILADLPRDLDLPVLLVQHMSEGFVEALATWLNTVCLLPVRLAEDGQRLRPGTVYVAPTGSNTLVRPGLRLELAPPAPGQFHVPGVDAAFASAAAVCGRRALGVLLTGMGRDGAQGLRAIRDAGGLTIGQDELTSVVWGMPAAAKALGGVTLELALPLIAAALVEATRGQLITGARR